ncbi:MAG: response regulator [Chloroflexaceae bacterium]|nr:response regulator [Chloroflexaceae bacterium]
MNTQIILVVDDALPNLHLLSVVLNRRGYRVVTASSGAEALHQVRQTPPNLIILDMMLPDMDGFSVYQQLQATPDQQAIPVIFASALTPTATLRQQHPELAHVPWLAKPFMINDLVQYVETALQSAAAAAAAPPAAEQPKAIPPEAYGADLAQPVWGTILIVDDTPDNLNLLSRILADYGYTIRTAATGARALRSIASEPPDLILLDIMLPDLSGYEISKQLKHNTATAPIPIIFISALDSLEDKLRAFQMGGVDYITKPFQSAEVLARVQTHLMLRDSVRQLERRNQQLHLLNQIGAVGLQAAPAMISGRASCPCCIPCLKPKPSHSIATMRSSTNCSQSVRRSISGTNRRCSRRRAVR